jgi:ATP-dependent phosphofructokinase / diphosphate-dependent phosphofructokinase
MAITEANGKRKDTLALLVCGGPAPGINSVIAAAAIEGMKCGLRVIGLREGFRWLAEGDTNHFAELKLEDISRIHLTGGTILGTSRINPARDEATLARVTDALTALGVRYLVCIGGDGTTYCAARVAERTKRKIGIVTVPKTIDNDLPLPENGPTFGFETARAVGAEIVESLMEDARSTGRWYIAVTMGRESGSLALGMCKSAGATLAVIPEEFRGNGLELEQVVETIAGAVIKRRASGHDNGVAIIAEGIALRMDISTLVSGSGSQTDPYGHLHIADIPLATVLHDRVQKVLKQLGVTVTLVAKDIGYELRCAKPSAFDIEYTRTLGYGAVRYLVSGGSEALIALVGGRVSPIHFDQLRDPDTGRVRVRTVDVSTESYEVARCYMIRLEPQDLEEPALSRLAAHTQLSPAAFKARFLPSVRATTAGRPPS